MKYVLINFLFFTTTLFSFNIENDVDVTLLSILHSESEQMLGKTSESSKPQDSNNFSSLYANALLNYDVSEDVFFSVGGKINRVTFEDNYDTPLYLRSKFTSKDINKEMLSEASLNYDDGFYALNIGRYELNYDWLLGSVDGALAMVGSDDDYSVRLFWFNAYHHLQYNYYMEIENINDNKGMYGAISKANFGALEFSFFDYFVEDLRNIMGTNISYIYKNVGFNFSYTSAIALDLALYDYDEEFFNGSLEFLIDNHFFEVGYSKTGENGLVAMIQMGNFMFGQFYLSNQVDRENSQNGFLKYIYANQNYRFEMIAGATQYDNSFYEIQNDMHSYEIDSYLKYNYSKLLSFDIGAMYMNVDERDPLQVNQALVMLNMVLSYENY